jgi:dihydrofolate reductase
MPVRPPDPTVEGLTAAQQRDEATDPQLGDLRGADEAARVGGAPLAGTAMRAGLIDEYAVVTHPVLVGGGTPFFTALDSWVNLNLVETRTFPSGVVLNRYETRR